MLHRLSEPVMAQRVSREALRDFFALHNPSNVENVDVILSHFADDHTALVAVLRHKYGDTPKLPTVIFDWGNDDGGGNGNVLDGHGGGGGGGGGGGADDWETDFEAMSTDIVDLQSFVTNIASHPQANAGMLADGILVNDLLEQVQALEVTEARLKETCVQVPANGGPQRSTSAGDMTRRSALRKKRKLLETIRKRICKLRPVGGFGGGAGGFGGGAGGANPLDGF
jgi:hypothetical protein